MTQIIFPHISRFNPAPILSSLEFTLFLVSFVGLLTINIALRSNPNTNYQPTTTLLRHPWTASLHVDLAQQYWDQGASADAKRELYVAQDFFAPPAIPPGTTNTLGATTAPLDLLKNWEQAPVQADRQYSLWQQIAKDRPDYRDAYRMLAALSYRRGATKQMGAYMAQARALDPTVIFPEAMMKSK